jgi:serine/threonine-protein kinase
MKPDRWEQVKALLDAVLECPPEARAAYLAEHVRDDPALQKEVAQLAAAFEAAGTFLEAPAPVVAASLVTEATAAFTAGERLGVYRLVRPLAQGGMGTVYLAERDDGQFEQQVAVKLIRQGLDTADVQRRFRAERQILARLAHPRIARLIDGGVTEAGRPYLVMEYVQGVPFDVPYCDGRRLGVTARLRLFLDVCEAVQYAHQNLVVHRDLKPSNILVIPATATTEARDQVKLLDFGIAKLLTDDPDDGQARTRTGLRVMTPEYAAPEQVRGEAVTTATDVYALGVLLYRLLTGQAPYRLEGLSTQEMERTILEAEPPRPSVALTQALTLPEAAARARDTSLAALRRTLSGDLDTIVMMALRKEPARRYPSVEAFAEDLRRFLDGRPVRARKDTLWYRAAKFSRRHRVGVVGSLLFVAFLVAYAITTSVQARQIVRERDKAEQVSRYLVRLFKVADPYATTPDALTVRDVLENGVTEVDQALGKQPDVQAHMLSTIGRVYHNLGYYDQARMLAERALAIRKRIYGASHPEVAASLNDLADARCFLGDLEVSDSLYRAAFTMRQALLGPRHPDNATTLHDWGLLLYYLNRQAESEAYLQQAVDLRRALFGDRDPSVAEALHSLGATVAAGGRAAAAEPMIREALSIRRAVLDSDHPDIPANMLLLARLIQAQGRMDEALALGEEALALQRRRLGNDHPLIANSLYTLAVMQRANRTPAVADRLLQEALDIRRHRLGNRHSGVADLLHLLGQVRLDQGDTTRAVEAFEESYAILKEVHGTANPGTQEVLRRLADLYETLGRSADATRYRALVQPTSPDTR